MDSKTVMMYPANTVKVIREISIQFALLKNMLISLPLNKQVYLSDFIMFLVVLSHHYMVDDQKISILTLSSKDLIE